MSHGEDNTLADTLSKNKLPLFHSLYPQAHRQQAAVPHPLQEPVWIERFSATLRSVSPCPLCLSPPTVHPILLQPASQPTLPSDRRDAGTLCSFSGAAEPETPHYKRLSIRTQVCPDTPGPGGPVSWTVHATPGICTHRAQETTGQGSPAAETSPPDHPRYYGAAEMHNMVWTLGLTGLGCCVHRVLLRAPFPH